MPFGKTSVKKEIEEQSAADPKFKEAYEREVKRLKKHLESRKRK